MTTYMNFNYTSILQSDLLVVRASGHIMNVGMELNGIHVGEMSHEYSQWHVLFGLPKLSSSIIRTGNEIRA